MIHNLHNASAGLYITRVYAVWSGTGRYLNNSVTVWRDADVIVNRQIVHWTIYTGSQQW